MLSAADMPDRHPSRRIRQYVQRIVPSSVWPALFPFVALGQTALGGLAVEAREVVARLVHHLDDLS